MTNDSPFASPTWTEPEDLAFVVSMFVTILSFTVVPIYLLLA